MFILYSIEQLKRKVINMTIKEASVKWGCTVGRVNQLANQGRIPGAVRSETALWSIPDDATMPTRLKPGRKAAPKADA